MGRDIAAFFIGGGADSGNGTSDSSVFSGRQPATLPVSDEMDHFYSVIDRCGMSVIVDQVCSMLVSSMDCFVANMWLSTYCNVHFS